MKQLTRTLLSLSLSASLLVCLLAGCQQNSGTTPLDTDHTSPVETTDLAPSDSTEAEEETTEQDDIIVLFTNDVHCGVDDTIGYAGLAAYKAYCESITPHTTLVDCGDAVQGDLIGAVSDGEYIIDIMNELDYDLAILGNHEFDYGMEQLTALLEQANATYLGCNITYTGTGTNAVAAVKPYEIIEYGSVSVAYIGVSTPYTMTTSTPTHFMENGEFVYQFNCGGADAFYDRVQDYVDECEQQGADHVVLLTHLGDTEDFAPYSAVNLIQNITGVDVVLDGHAHNEIPCHPVKDEAGEVVLLSSPGTKLENIGQLTISENGTITVGLISRMDWADTDTDTFIKNIQSLYEQALNEVVGTSQATLPCYTPDGIRLVRNRETAIGNLCADAYRAVTGADIGLINGGGVRADLAEGDITYADIISINPFGNSICMVEATGQEIIDALEVAYYAVEAEYQKDGKAYGENGSFLQVSGLKLTVDTSIASPVVFDDIGMVVSIGDVRRVMDVQVMNDAGEYEPIDPEAIYTVASHNYLLKESGGNHDIFTDNLFLIDEGASDYEVLISYITDHLGGVVGSVYAETEGRIIVR